MDHFLRDAAVHFVVVVVVQSEDGRAFNRGQLLNVGFREAQRHFAPSPLDAVVFHDVDLLPSAGLRQWYVRPPERGRPAHIAGPSTWSKYAMDGYDEIFFGGVTALHAADFEACNGFPNDYWGWGMEDDQLRLRAAACGAIARGVERPPRGTGAFRDLDPVRMLELLQTRESLQAHGGLFNQKMFVPNRGPQVLDREWRGANGLRGLRYQAARREQRGLTGGAAWLQVSARLGG
jgi:hypothetical protein